ncbi:hypothetical protein [Fibrella arboris]|uniref:hypothetical protein n=1 Tax=Fibrella arboris TaxID=3242486 RepID=UPI0035214974
MGFFGLPVMSVGGIEARLEGVGAVANFADRLAVAGKQVGKVVGFAPARALIIRKLSDPSRPEGGRRLVKGYFRVVCVGVKLFLLTNDWATNCIILSKRPRIQRSVSGLAGIMLVKISTSNIAPIAVGAGGQVRRRSAS